MSDVGDILGYAWAKDAVNLKPALDNILSAKAAEAISNMTADVAASMFGATSGNDESSSETVVMNTQEESFSTKSTTDYFEGTPDA